MKRCNRCGFECSLEVASEYFYKHKTSKSGYRYECKSCQAAYHTANREAILKRKKQYHEANREAILKRKKQYYEANRDTELERVRQYYEANREAKLAYDKQYREDNREAIAEYAKQWQKSNRDRMNAIGHKRRTKKRGNGGSYTVAEEKLLLQWQGAKCAYCQCDISNSYERDHIMPVSKSGTSYITNIALSCKSCNSSKGNKILWLWKNLIFALEFFEQRKQFNILLATSKL